MKIGILTFHRENNYGAILQAFALATKLSDLGHFVYFIDYHRTKKAQIIKSLLSKNPKVVFNRTADFLYEKRKNRVFEDFRKKYFKLSKEQYYSAEDIYTKPPEADVYIAGSDQVWSFKMIDPVDLPVYWLNFGDVRTKKISYAASFGSSVFDQRQIDFVHQQSKNLYLMSIRERESIQALGINTNFVPDPTFLTDWVKYLKNNDGNRTIPKYFIINSNNLVYIKKIKKILAPRLANMSNLLKLRLTASALGPFEWIDEIRSSSFVITDSYHGTLFCIMTHTPFISVFWNNDTGGRNLRQKSILDYFGLQHRIFHPAQETFSNNVFSENWEIIDTKIENLRKIGTDFLELL
jgi:hypothetical protein